MNDMKGKGHDIYIITARMHDGGTATISHNYYKMFKKNNWNVKVVTLEKLPVSAKFNDIADDLISLNLFDLRQGVMSLSMLKSIVFNFISFLSFMRECKGSVIFVHFLPILLGGGSWFFRKKGCKYIFTVHTDIFSFKKKIPAVKKVIFSAFERMLQLCDSLVFITPDVTNKFVNAYPTFQKVITIPNVFYSDKVQPSDDPLDPTRFILYSGRLSSEKNIGFIIDSYVKYRNIGGHRKLVIAGDGPEYISLSLKAQNSSHAEDITFLGHVDDVVSLYNRAAYLVLASKYEGFGLVILEAIDYFLPVLSSNCESGPYYILSRESSSSFNTKYENGLGVLLPIPNGDNIIDYANGMLHLDSKVISKKERFDCLRFFSDSEIYPIWERTICGER